MPTLLIVAKATNLVMNVVLVDDPSHYTPDDGFDAVPQSDAASAVAIGWTRQADGSFSAPPIDLVGYANAVATQIENGGTTWNEWPVKTNGEAQRMALGELAAIDEGERQDGEMWGFADGVARALTNDEMKALSKAIRAHVKASHVAYMQVKAGLAASPPTITTTAQIDAAFAQVA